MPSAITSGGIRTIRGRDVMHEEYMELMEYLENYKESICYSA